MITDLHILKGFHGVIRKYFPSIPIVDKDIKTLKRPAFYIQDVTRKDENISSGFFQSIKGFNITYFGSDDKTGNIELVRIKEYLSNIFLKPVKIKIETEKESRVFYFEIDSIDVKINRNENFVSCDLVVVIQQRKFNVPIEEVEKQEETTIVVDYENNLDSENFNEEYMEKLEDKMIVK